MDDLFLKWATSNGAQELLNQAKQRCLVLIDGNFQQHKIIYVCLNQI